MVGRIQPSSTLSTPQRARMHRNYGRQTVEGVLLLLNPFNSPWMQSDNFRGKPTAALEPLPKGIKTNPHPPTYSTCYISIGAKTRRADGKERHNLRHGRGSTMGQDAAVGNWYTPGRCAVDAADACSSGAIPVISGWVGIFNSRDGYDQHFLKPTGGFAPEPESLYDRI